jgi:hypothetical protein
MHENESKEALGLMQIAGGSMDIPAVVHHKARSSGVMVSDDGYFTHTISKKGETARKSHSVVIFIK